MLYDLLAYLAAPPRLALAALAVFALVAHRHGRERLRFGRQLTDPSSFALPLNALVRLYSLSPNTPYLDPAELPGMRIVTENWRALRDEGLRLMEAGKIGAGDADIAFQTFFRRGWRRFYLKWYGHPLPSAQALCPKSVALLAQIPEVRGAMFAMLPSGGRLGRHRDPFAGFIRYHLGLRTPNSDACWIAVDGERRSWRDGEALLFDETFVHEASNGTEVDRLILFCDVERPLAGLMAPFNRWITGVLMGLSGAPNEAGEPVGPLNAVYVRLAGAHAMLRRLKERRLALYRLQKWTAFALVGALFLAPY